MFCIRRFGIKPLKRLATWQDFTRGRVETPSDREQSLRFHVMRELVY